MTSNEGTAKAEMADLYFMEHPSNKTRMEIKKAEKGLVQDKKGDAV